MSGDGGTTRGRSGAIRLRLGWFDGLGGEIAKAGSHEVNLVPVRVSEMEVMVAISSAEFCY